MVINKFLTSIAVLVCLVCVFCSGVYYGQETFEPRTQIVEVPIEVPPEIREKVVEKIVEIEKIVEKIVEVPISLKQFESLAQLNEWLSDGGIHLFTTCDAYALWLQDRALKDGYLMSFGAIYPEEYNSLFSRMRIDGFHAINSVIIDKEFYYIEPQTMEVVLGGKLN